MSYNNIIPEKHLEGIDLIYSPGKIIFNEFPWVVEIDNVAVLAYYNLFLLNLLKPVIKSKLKSKFCRNIICISEAAKKSVVNYFKDAEIEKKCSVVYPYVELMKHREKKKSGKIKLLYIATQFYLKGGKEILRVFERITGKYPDLELYMITNAPEEIKQKYSAYRNIFFVPATLEKQKLYDKYYSECDVFLQLSFQDSFGLVNLEAISAGLPVIATDMFAIPEIVENGRNGFILKSPIAYFKRDFTPNPEFWGVDLNEYARVHDFPDLEEECEKKLCALIENKKSLRSMSGHSLWLVRKGKFNESLRKKNLKRALEGHNVRN